MTTIDLLTQAHEAMTPGPWRTNNNRYIVQSSQITRDVWRIPHKEEDIDGIVFWHNHGEQILSVLRAADIAVARGEAPQMLADALRELETPR